MPKPLTSEELNTRLWDALGDRAFGFMGLNGHSDDAPMTVHRHDGKTSAVWIFTTHAGPIAQGGAATYRFVAKDQELFARISGNLAPEHDQSVFDDLWSRQIAAWYPGGKDDPNLLLLRFDVDQSEVWVADMSVWSVIKLIVGADVHDDFAGQHGIAQAA